jgi:hypothetical protein
MADNCGSDHHALLLIISRDKASTIILASRAHDRRQPCALPGTCWHRCSLQLTFSAGHPRQKAGVLRR